MKQEIELEVRVILTANVRLSLAQGAEESIESVYDRACSIASFDVKEGLKDAESEGLYTGHLEIIDCVGGVRK
jgi:hypothetical protein